MKKSFIILFILCSCTAVEQALPEPQAGERRYVSVGISLDAGNTKSVIDQSAEAFRSAVLYAMNPSTGRILKYGENAGALSGTPLYLYTETNSFSWPLPAETPINIYCMINPPADFLSGTQAEGLTESALRSKLFVCSGPEALRNLSGGLPMTGVLEVDEWQITLDDASLSIPVRNLFAKYHFSLDPSDLGSGETLTVTNLSVSRGNTSVPYFGDGYAQNDATLLKDFDYATSSQLAALSKGGPSGGTDIYVLENCHGTHSGASSWWTVYRDLCHTWPEINKCTSVLLSYNISDEEGCIKSYATRVFLGSGNMTDDFDVRRNLYKSVTVKASRRTGDLDPFLDFPSDTYFIAPGTEITVSYGSNVHSVSLEATSPEIWITDAEGYATAEVTVTGNNPSAGEVRLRAAAGCPVGTQLWLNGGVRSPFYWPPYGSNAQAFTERRKLETVQSRTLTFDAPQGDIYPYMEAAYLSRERYTYSAARDMASSVKITEISGSIDATLTSVSVVSAGSEYAVKLALVPSRPGNVSFSATYGESEDIASGPSVTVREPVVRCFGSTHVDVYGTRTELQWKLMDKDGLAQLPATLRGGALRVSKRDPYGTALRVQVTGNSVSSTSCTSTLYLAGFGGLPGFEAEDYSFSGLSIPVEGTFTYPGGYSVSLTVNAVLDNPLEGYSYDGRTYSYSVLQGKSAQPQFVSVTNGSYTVENLMTWPLRQFTVDLTRGGTRACSGMEAWTEYSEIPSLEPFALSGGKAGFAEDLSRWGPVYYGRRVTNSESGETVKFVHSVIRLYCHFNVFATFDAQEKNRVRVDWDNQGGIDWSPTMLLHYHFGSFQARMVSNVNQSPHMNAIAALLTTDVTASTRVNPVLDGYQLYSGNLAGHGTYTPGYHNEYQLYRADYNGGNRSYMLGYYDRPGIWGYDINYDWVYYDGVDGSNDFIYWRLIASSNKPWFKIGKGSITASGKYVSAVRKNAAGDYCFNVLGSPSGQSFYLDHEGLGYLRLHLWWEGKDGRVMVGSRDLHPLTSFNKSLCIVNGWYDPRPYTGGIPILKEKVGMYFFPESSTSNTRSGYPPYYSTDWPFTDCPQHGFMEISTFSHLSFGDLFQRDSDAER